MAKEMRQQEEKSQPIAKPDPKSDIDKEHSGMNPDMPDSIEEASGQPRGKKWGDNNCR